MNASPEARGRRAVVVLALLFGSVAGSFAACTDQREPPSSAARPSARSSTPTPADDERCPAAVSSTTTGSVRDPALDEISGVVAGHRLEGVLWVEEDSGNDAAVYALEPTGEVVASVVVDGATNEDWEDLAWADGRLWVGDIGDNDRARSEIQVYSFPEPRDAGVTRVDAEILRLRYEDGARDAEALFVDPRDGTLYVIEKAFLTRESGVYAVALDDVRPGTVGVLRRVATIPMSTVTAADLGPGGIAVRNYIMTWFIPWSDDRSVVATLERSPCTVALGPSEALAQTVDGAGLYSIPEGVEPPIGYASLPTEP